MIPAQLVGALTGVRVLSLEQAVALPFATRHLAELGADVIRVQSFKRAKPGGLSALELTRRKRQLGLDLASEGGPELFRQLAARCDVVAHNFTPRVARKFGIDHESIQTLRPDVIYVSLTGFGTSGPWGGRPLFGPGAEAVSGHNLLIGDPDGWPGRPGTGVYADDVCGLYTAYAVLGALDERERSGRGQHIDISLYETMVAHLGPVLAERARGASPSRSRNRDERWAIHDVFDARGTDRHVAVAAVEAELPAVARALEIDEVSASSVAAAIRRMDAYEAQRRLQESGVAASVVADASDVVTDPHLWSRGYFEMRQAPDSPAMGYPHLGATWGGNADGIAPEPNDVGADNVEVLRDLLKLDDDELKGLADLEVIGGAQTKTSSRRGGDAETRIARGELSRVDSFAGGPPWSSLTELRPQATSPHD
jgi:crotonobetainyl-CoA:carnitine CoA-transferase CaiB-like acyl-CoA transferase